MLTATKSLRQVRLNSDDPDLILVMELQAGYAADAARQGKPEARADAQAKWRKAYFAAIRDGVIEEYPYPDQDSIHLMED